MSYRSERQCQLCGQRNCLDRAQTAWASGAQRSAPIETHTSVCVRVCVCVSGCARALAPLFICCRDRDITSRISKPLRLQNVTQHFVWSCNWRLVWFVLVIVVRHVS